MCSKLSNIGYPISRLQKKSRLSAIRGSIIHPQSKVESGSQIVNVRMDRHSFCGYDCVLLNVDVGAFCSIADRVYIGGSGHPMHFVSTSPVFLSHKDSVRTKFSRHDYSNLPKTVVGHDVWIGYGALVKAGVNIGHGAVVGMGAVVTRNVEPYSIVTGNPAREMRKRFSPEQCTALLASRWWEFDDEKPTKAAVHFTNVEDFLKSEGLI